VNSPYTYTNPCPTTVPASITALPTTYHVPTSVAPFDCVTTSTCTEQNPNGFASVAGCPAGQGVKVFAPGYYTSKPNLKQGGFSTYFFESGIYYFKTGGWGAVGSDSNPPWIIGGAPSSVDNVDIASGAPCWSALSSSGYFTNPAATSPPGGSWQTGGTGVEWILGDKAWLDVHTVNLELFTRLAPTADQALIEGGQGISIREVSPSPPTGWTVSNPGGTLQIIQVDANNHNPNVSVHGGLFVPNNNLEFFTNQHQVKTGPIMANSLEMAFATVTSPPLRINPSSDVNTGQYEFIAKATTDGSDGLAPTSLYVEAVVTFDRTQPGYPFTTQSWRVR